MGKKFQNMIAVKNLHMDKRRTTSSLSNLSERDVHFTYGKNLRSRCNTGIVGSDRQEEQGCKLDKMGQQPADRRVIDRITFKRLKSKAVVVTTEDRRKIVENLMADRERLENESAARKQKLQSYDVMRTKGKQLAQVSTIMHINNNMKYIIYVYE